MSKPGVAKLFNKITILLHFPADMTSEETQSVETVLFFMHLQYEHMQKCTRFNFNNNHNQIYI